MLVALVVLAGCADPAVGPVHPGTITNVVTITEMHTVTVTEYVDPPCRLDEPGWICTWAGIPGVAQFSPDGLVRKKSPLYLPSDVAFDPLEGRPYLVDWNNHRIRTVEADDTVVTVAGTGFLGAGIFDEAEQTWNDGPALEYAFTHPTRVAFDPLDPGAFFIADWQTGSVVRVADGIATRVAGDRTPDRTDDDDDDDGITRADEADLYRTSSAVFDVSGALYIMQQDEQVIRAVTRDGVISDFAGTRGVAGYAGDGGPASSALFRNELGNAADPSGALAHHEGALYVADTDNQVIRRIELSTGIITTVAGAFERHPTGIDTTGDGVPDSWPGVPAYAGDGGSATEARLNDPRDIAFGPDGAMYIADTGNHCIRVVRDGIVETFAGTCTVAGEADDGPDPLLATLNTPFGVEVDAAGNVFIADTYNHVIRVVWAQP